MGGRSDLDVASAEAPMMFGVGLAGLEGSGKDEAAKHLVEKHGFTRLGFADQLKAEVRQRMRLTMLAIGRAVMGPNSLPEEELLDILETRKPEPIRRLYQEYGSEIRRGDDSDYWLRAWMLRWYETGTHLPVVIPDVRFTNEAEMIRKKGGRVALVVRPGLSSSDPHISTQYARRPHGDFDRVIQNSGTLAELHAQVDEWIRGL